MKKIKRKKVRERNEKPNFEEEKKRKRRKKKKTSE
jgi:hypothetical protein